MVFKWTSLILFFCLTVYSGIQVGDFAPHEIGNTWVYERTYSYYFPTEEGRTEKFTRTFKVISNWKQSDTEFVAIEILDTGHIFRSGNWGDTLESDTIFRFWIDTCVFLTGTILDPDEPLNGFGSFPFFRNNTIDIDSLSKLQNGDTGLYYFYRGAVYEKDVGLCVYRYSNGLMHSESYIMNLKSFNGKPYSLGTTIVLESFGKIIKENDTLKLGKQQLGMEINFRYNKYDKFSNRLGIENVYWKITGSLNNSILQSRNPYYLVINWDVTEFQEGYLIATPVDSGIVLNPDRVYLIIDPKLSIMHRSQSTRETSTHQFWNIYNLQGRKLPFYGPENAISPGFKILYDNKDAKKQLLLQRHQ